MLWSKKGLSFADKCDATDKRKSLFSHLIKQLFCHRRDTIEFPVEFIRPMGPAMWTLEVAGFGEFELEAFRHGFADFCVYFVLNDHAAPVSFRAEVMTEAFIFRLHFLNGERRHLVMSES